MRRGVVLTGFLLVTATGPACAQNLLQNPAFDGDASGWSMGLDFDGYDTKDANGSPTSGSAEGLSIAGGSAAVIAQCVPVTAGFSYVFGATIFIPSGQTVSGSAHVDVVWYSVGNCSSGILGQHEVVLSATNAWHPLSTTVTAPTGTTYAYYLTGISASAAGFKAYFDDALLRRPQDIFADGFESGVAGHWSTKAP